ncbi:hypothetical protein Aab01nite_79580 [Paractinoplanes abujensis]|uniref:Uncharacterized protein (DUF2252 family) n=1 Tax=Paractinoplanes abujensis TaxID=882441 RepID=A0A7W7CR42_9ACTN|nr:DUF2252 domain-containing protein [Actinoplanes abujensis]MBB4693167.1 uncharacterized protein (DUF2252 family) [Actinoplanes abujensis]GID24368.1 hypothetical protein Aab01nite_79580 [Actinoplanes abujensis]
MTSESAPRVRASATVTADVRDGRRARRRAPRRAAALWDPGARRMRALDRLRAQEAVRDPALLPLRYARMASSPWAYLRGAAAVMAADLATAPHSGLTVQMCGDAHILNFGLWASPERQLLFDARDFDETLPGPFEWDLKRLTTSIYVLAETERLSPACAEEAATAAVGTYREAMGRYAVMGELDVWYDRITSDVPLKGLTSEFAEATARTIAKQSRKRTHHGVAQQLVTEEDGRRRIALDPMKRLDDGLSHEQRVRAAEEFYDTYLASISPHLRRLVNRFQRVDSVRQIVGVGSVGMRVWLNLLEGDSGRQPVFSQAKQATASVYEEFLGPGGFANHGERVIVGQRLMQSASDIFLGHMRVDGFDYYVRQYRDMKIIPDGKQIAGYLPQFAATCGHALAKSHARSGDPAAIAGYIGRGNAFRDGILGYARDYAQQTHGDHAELRAAIAAGEIQAAERGW